jgi:anti-sigma regulatory factor (Ser/Thr protein kinase)
VTERRTTVSGDAAQLPVLVAFLQQFWSDHSLPAPEAFPFELSLEEIFMNVAMHGVTATHRPQVEVCLKHADGGVILTITDDGPAFDPLQAPPPDLEADLEDRPVGGLGIHLVREMMDEVTYQRLDGRNLLRMRRRLGS